MIDTLMFPHLEGAPMPETAVVIYSALEAAKDMAIGASGGFWSTEKGWGRFEEATVFSASEDVNHFISPEARKVTFSEALQIVAMQANELENQYPHDPQLSSMRRR